VRERTDAASFAYTWHGAPTGRSFGRGLVFVLAGFRPGACSAPSSYFSRGCAEAAASDFAFRTVEWFATLDHFLDQSEALDRADHDVFGPPSAADPGGLGPGRDQQVAGAHPKRRRPYYGFGKIDYAHRLAYRYLQHASPLFLRFYRGTDRICDLTQTNPRAARSVGLPPAPRAPVCAS
jgi:hypothetical protein